MSTYYNVLLMISFVPFLVYFMLSWRDHIRQSALSLFEGPGRVVAHNTWRNVAEVARAYVFGNFLLGILLSVASTICFWSWHLPYWLMLGPISGFLSLVPYVGLPLAIIPPLIGALAVYANLPPYLIIAATVGFLHLLALNLLYPQVVGGRVHLNPLAVTVALMFWGTIWGGIGLRLAIPITAGAKAVLDSIEDLEPYGKLLGD
jgi:predicted PurR-regulated permease PerM